MSGLFFSSLSITSQAHQLRSSLIQNIFHCFLSSFLREKSRKWIACKWLARLFLLPLSLDTIVSNYEAQRDGWFDPDFLPSSHPYCLAHQYKVEKKKHLTQCKKDSIRKREEFLSLFRKTLDYLADLDHVGIPRKRRANCSLIKC
jgi:hypothetical protein